MLRGQERGPDSRRLHDRGDAAVHHEDLAVDPAAAGLARYTTNGATCSGASGSTAPSGAAPIRSAVMAVRARGQMALARTPYLPQLRAVVTVSATRLALAAA